MDVCQNVFVCNIEINSILFKAGGVTDNISIMLSFMRIKNECNILGGFFVGILDGHGEMKPSL